MSTVDGLPAHVLLVHAVVVLVPLTALLVLLVSFWPAARRRLVWPTAVLAVTALVSVPLTTEARVFPFRPVGHSVCTTELAVRS